MAITERTVQNKRNSVGELTGKPGIVYDVNIKHKVNGQQKTHSKKGFATKKRGLAVRSSHEKQAFKSVLCCTYSCPTENDCGGIFGGMGRAARKC